MRARLHDCPGPWYIAHIMVTDRRAVPLGVQRIGVEYQHELQLFLRVRRYQAVHGLSRGEDEFDNAVVLLDARRKSFMVRL